MKPGDDSTSIPFPSALLAKVQAAAEEEHRPPHEIVREAIERYLESRHQLKAPAASAAEKARNFEAWARSHPRTPSLPHSDLQQR